MNISAKDIMSTKIASIAPDASARMAAKTMLKRKVSALLVLDSKRRLLGVISEGDLVHRIELDTRKKGSWWLNLLTPDRDLARDYARAHGRKVGDAMSRNVVTVSPEARLPAIVALMDKHRIKRVPVVNAEGKPVGVVSRADVLAAFAKAALDAEDAAPLSDAEASAEIRKRLRKEAWSDSVLLNVSVERGNARVGGICASKAQADAIRALCAEVPGIRHVDLDALQVSSS
ncbi:MAG: CBS domain-containing protein, partial [Tagaea sp.]|nr:CBS domain-containing protein [Tagaea sp.]